MFMDQVQLWLCHVNRSLF